MGLELILIQMGIDALKEDLGGEAWPSYRSAYPVSLNAWRSNVWFVISAQQME